MQDIKSIKSHYLYNMLQDFRHLLIFDLRPPQEFDRNHIRDSFSLHPDVHKQQINDIIELSIKKAEEKEKKYTQLKKIRRYFIITAKEYSQHTLSNQDKGNIEAILAFVPKDPVNKFYALAGGFYQYHHQYPFTCLQREKLEKLQKQNASKQEQQRWLLYPYCRFPTQIIPGKLYLGNIYSSNSEKQLNDLKIKCLVDFIDYKLEQDQTKQVKGNPIPSFKKNQAKYSFLQLPFNKQIQVNINFDEINEEIQKRVSHGTTLLYCEDGETISAVFAISYLMYKTNLQVSLATLKVCQAIARTDLNKWIYSQLLTYKPAKKNK